MQKFDAIVLGGGFYGCCIALLLSQRYAKVALIEKESGILQKASSLNQARVHGGYHYPRNFMTATRSQINYTKFLKDFDKAIINNIEHIYAISKFGSKTNAKQFFNLFKTMGAPISTVPSKLFNQLFNPNLIENAYFVNEAIFDWTILQNIIFDKLTTSSVSLFLNTEIEYVTKINGFLNAHTVSGDIYQANQIVSCLYANLNWLQKNSGASLLPLKYELAELALVEVPSILKQQAITVMDGHFFSLLPYPQKNLHTLSHVRYTPHSSWIGSDNHLSTHSNKMVSNYIYMKQDAMRYVPLLKDMQYAESFYEIKTVLQRNESDDGRPILFREEPTIPKFFNVMGSKIDNIYDVLDVISEKCLTKCEDIV